ncbi:MAG: methionyl-tRNA formyltransferase [Deltaproteobacteria bacterium]|nr:methionyl-tRNA formyltransferase [Candidatus Zymogenaceae bacterium]
MGTPDFAVPSLVALAESNDVVRLVVTQPDRPRGRGRKALPPPVKTASLDLGIPIAQPENIRDPEFMETLKGESPDFICVVAFGRILPGDILSIPKGGSINVHASLLPEYRGAGPINRAIIDGKTRTGVTTMLMDEGMDTGDILLFREVPIDTEQTAGELSDVLSRVGATLLVETILGLKRGDITPVPQNDADASYAPMLKKTDGGIDWSSPAPRIESLVRGVTPWPGAYTTYNGEVLKVFCLRDAEGNTDAAPGTVVSSGPDGIVVATGRGTVLICELQCPGKRRMNVREYLCGRDIPEGAVFGT